MALFNDLDIFAFPSVPRILGASERITLGSGKVFPETGIELPATL